MTDLQAELEATIAKHHVPGATLGVFERDKGVEVYAAGITNKNTGVEVTHDTLFQIGSVTKAWTATVVMMLVDEGVLDLDAPVVKYLPELRVLDPDVTARVTLRHFLSHTSGIGGDHILETGRGDDTLERYVETCAEIGQEFEMGATMSYCNTGYSLAGRILEKVTGQVWDKVMRDRLFEPLGLTHTNTLPEEALLFRTAVGHVKQPGHDEYEVAPVWLLPRSAGPAGLINSTAEDVLGFARLHLDDGRGPDGRQLLSVGAVKQMQEPQVEVPDRYSLGDRWGIGWILFNWDGRHVYGHDGDTLGQHAFLRIVPDAGLALCLQTNGGEARRAFSALASKVLGERAGITVPQLPSAPDAPPDLDLDLYTGTFKRLNVEMTIRRDPDGSLSAKAKLTGPLADLIPDPHRHDDEKGRIRLTPVDRSLFLASSEQSATPSPFVFFDFDGDVPRRIHYGARAVTRA